MKRYEQFTSKVSLSRVLFLSSILCVCTITHTAQAQETQIMSVAPPLFQISVAPGDLWNSGIKVINSNPYTLTVYAEVVKFEAVGESGQGKFTPLLNQEEDATSLASWINITSGPHVIPRERSSTIPFFVEVPEDASPGGHYAAVLITTQPPDASSERMAVHTSQAVTSLFFARVEGDVEENGSIREFRTLKSFLPRPEAEFSLRFENKGNVHLQPRGNIIITNMWGTQKGIIPINYQTHFGNVLPQSIRDFTFTWKSDFEVTDIGRYKAMVSLAYGENGIKSVSGVTYFWVIPVKVTLITLLIIVIGVALVVWMIKAYVRRMLSLAGVDIHQQNATLVAQDESHTQTQQEERITYRKIAAPIKDGVLDLRHRLDATHESLGFVSIVLQFVIQYKVFFGSVIILILMFVSVVVYIDRATVEDTDYTVTIKEDGIEKEINRADIETTSIE